MSNIAVESDDIRHAIKDAGGIPPLVELARAGNAQAREFAVFTFGALFGAPDVKASIKVAGGVAALLEISRGSDPKLKEVALKVIAMMGPPSSPSSPVEAIPFTMP